MTTPLNLVSWNDVMRDYYPLPGTRIKQYVLEERREAAWARSTCPTVHVPAHEDNCECGCRNSGPTPWIDLDHDSCCICGDLHEATRDRTDVQAWLAERAARPPVTTDHDALSDEIEPEMGKLKSWLTEMLPKTKEKP